MSEMKQHHHKLPCPEFKIQGGLTQSLRVQILGRLVHIDDALCVQTLTTMCIVWNQLLQYESAIFEPLI